MKKILKGIRLKNGLTQAEMAAEFKCSQGFWSQLESGKAPVPIILALRMKQRLKLTKRDLNQIQLFIDKIC